MTGDVIKRTSCARVMAGGLGGYAATVGVALHGESMINAGIWVPFFQEFQQ